jgi:hypothetical protein
MALKTAGGERKSMSATHMGMISRDPYFSHFMLAVPRRSTGVSKSNRWLFFISYLPANRDRIEAPRSKLRGMRSQLQFNVLFDIQTAFLYIHIFKKGGSLSINPGLAGHPGQQNTI